jgi:hypothetical protein
VRKSVIFLAGGAVVLLAGAAVLRFGVLPAVHRLPSDLDTTVTLSGKADLLDQTALKAGSLASALVSGADVTVKQSVKVTSAKGDAAAVLDHTVLTRGATTISDQSHTWYVNRVSLAPATPPSSVTAEPHEGLVVGFPLTPAPHDYVYWDTLTQAKANARYTKAEKRGGRDCYVYTVHTNGPLKDRSILDGLPKTVDRSVIEPYADLVPLLKPLLALLPPQLAVTYPATGDTTYWVDKATGYVIDVRRQQTISANLQIGVSSTKVVDVFKLDVRMTPESVAAETKAATEAADGLRLVGVVAPLVLVGVAVVLLIVAVVLGARRRPSIQPEQPVQPAEQET